MIVLLFFVGAFLAIGFSVKCWPFRCRPCGITFHTMHELDEHALKVHRYE